MALNTHSIDLELDSNQYLTAADHSALSVTGNLTIELWVKFESLPAGTDQMGLVSKFNATANKRSYSFILNGNSGDPQLRLSISANGTAVTSKQVAWSPSLATWYHVAVVYTAAAGTADFYVDGAQVGVQQTALPTSINDNDAAFGIGILDSADVGYLFDGLIDEVRLWATTRTEAQIANNRYSQIDSGSANLNGLWRLDNALTDSTANGNTLTNNGSAVFSTDIPFPLIVESDTAGTPTERGGFTGGGKAAFQSTLTDTAGAPTETARAKYGWSNLAKSSAPSWSNTQKS